jgi:Arm DNA-binding domain/Phage integrase, N-terminal SAM-like domain
VASAKDCELRDTVVPGFLLKVTPTGRKVFMVQYRTNAGARRKPAIGRFGELTVEQARSIVRDWLADVRKGKDPCSDKKAARTAPDVKELCAKFMEDYSKPKNRAETIVTNQRYIDRHIVSALGALKVPEVTRADIAGLITRMKKMAVTANRVLSCLHKMFNMVEDAPLLHPPRRPVAPRHRRQNLAPRAHADASRHARYRPDSAALSQSSAEVLQ